MDEGIIVDGSIDADLVMRVPRLPASGETILETAFEMIPGGKRANHAVAAARLRGEVSMIGKVGGYRLGDDLLTELGRCDVDVTHVDRVDGSSGVATILVDGQGANQISVFADGNGRVEPDFVRARIGRIRHPRSCAGCRTARPTLPDERAS